MIEDTHADAREAEAFVEEAAGRAAPGWVDEDGPRLRAEASREDAELARRELMAGGIDPERLDALAAERAEARRERAEDERRRAIDASETVRRRLVEVTGTIVLPDEPTNVIIDRVTFIRSFASGGVVVDSEIGSLDSWARYRFEGSASAITESGTGRLSFFTLWRNPRSDPVVVTAGARLVVNAHLSVDADWNGVAAWFISGSEARATVRARTTVWSMDSSVRAIVHDRILADAGATGGFFGGDDSASIAFNEFLPATGVTVPAEASVLIEVELLTEWVATSGSVRLDAESGAFRVEVPHLILTMT